MYCKNCSAYLPYSNDFCGECGAKVIRNRLTIKGIFHEVGEEYLIADNKLFLTFWYLLIKPERVIQSYIDGIRKRYLNVITYVAVSLTILGIYIFLIKTFYLEDSFDGGFSTGFLGDRKLSDLTVEQQKELTEKSKEFSLYMDRFLDFIGLITIITTPINALATYMIFITKKMHNYAEHLVINYYAAAQISILSSLLFIIMLPFFGNSPVGAILILPLTFVYQVYLFRRLYRISTFESIYKTVLYFILQTIMVFALMLLLTIIGVGIYWIINKM